MPRLNYIVVLTSCLMASQLTQHIFGQSMEVFRREAFVEISPLQYWIGKTIFSSSLTIIYAFAFSLSIYTFGAMEMDFSKFFAIMAVNFFTFDGLANISSVAFSQQLSRLAAVIFAFIMNLMSGFDPSVITLKEQLGDLQFIRYISPIGWLLQALFMAADDGYSPVWNIRLDGMREQFGFKNKYLFDDCLWIVLGYGVVFKLFTLILLEIQAFKLLQQRQVRIID